MSPCTFSYIILYPIDDKKISKTSSKSNQKRQQISRYMKGISKSLFSTIQEMKNHSSILAWEIPWTVEPVDYSPWGVKRVGHSLATKQKSSQRNVEHTCTRINKLEGQRCLEVTSQGFLRR